MATTLDQVPIPIYIAWYGIIRKSKRC
jgi:hypothetical protein